MAGLIQVVAFLKIVMVFLVLIMFSKMVRWIILEKNKIEWLI